MHQKHVYIEKEGASLNAAYDEYFTRSQVVVDFKQRMPSILP